MKIHVSPKKWLAGLLAAVLLCTGMPSVGLGSGSRSGSAVQAVIAAGTYGLRFYDSTTGEESQNTQIVEGSSINIRATLPENYQFSDPPFFVHKTGDPADASSFIKITPDVGRNYYTLLAMPGSSGTNPSVISSAEYTLNAIYTGFLSSGTGTGRKPAGTTPAVNFVLDAQVVGSPVAVTEESTLSFKATAEESETVDDISTVTIDPIKATGAFVPFHNIDLGSISITRGTGGRYFHLLLQSGAKTLELNVYIQGLPAGTKIPQDTVFTINFVRETLNELIVTVVSPKKLVEDTAASIRQNPTDPEATGTGKPYVQLASGETLQSITQNFNMYSGIHRLNVNADISWAWVPDNPAHQNNVDIKQRQGSTTLDVFDIINRPQEDMKGKLVATVTYGGQTSTAAEIPITVYGTGLPPTIIPLEKWTGNPSRDSGDNPKKERITALPTSMDIYQGDANYAFYREEPRGPFKFTFSVNYGASRGRAESMKITYLGDGGEVEMRVDGSPVAYTWGTELVNLGVNRSFEVTASKLGQVRLQIEFYDVNGDAMRPMWKNWSAYVYDSRPSSDGKLELLNLRGFNANGEIDKKLKELYPDHVIPYGFAPDNNDYGSIIVPNKVEEITLQPRIPTGTGAVQDIQVELVGGPTETVRSNSQTGRIALVVGVPRTLRVTVTAQDGSTNTYTMKVTRGVPSPDSTLSALEAYRADPPDTYDYVPEFKPTLYNYSFTVPYGVTALRVVAEPNNAWATVVIDPLPRSSGILFWKTEESIALNGRFNPDTGRMEDATTVITATVTSEEGTTSKYTLTVTREAPDDVRTLSMLEVYDADGNVIPFLKNGAETTFDPIIKEYVVEIPYSLKKINILANATSLKTVNLLLKYPEVFGGRTETRNYISEDRPVEWYGIDVSQGATPDEAKNQFAFGVSVTAESQRVTDPPYTIRFDRKPADTDNRLLNLMLDDQDGTPVPEFTFGGSEMLTYDISVAYLTKSVKITPVAYSDYATVTVNGAPITENKNYATMQLDTGKKTTATIVVTAEDGSVRTYTLNITRSKPSSDARLSDLVVGTYTLKPKFVPAKTSYSVTIPDPVKTYTITATPVDAHATITIDGKAATSGVPSAPIQPTEAVTKVDVVVTAQDGKTKKTYTITVTAEVLVPVNSNADLKSLALSADTDLNPRFRPANVDYEVYVKDDTYSVTIEPRTDDRHAKVDVRQGTRSLSDYYGNFSSTLIEDENQFTIIVTASDKKTTKEYNLTVYRNNEEKQGRMQLVTAEAIDYAQASPIIVDISKYPIVAADVFNTLRTEYPDKSIIFEGNDYSLEVNGKDLKRLVPNTEQFDFSLSFISPEEDDIIDLLSEDTRNEALDPVMVYFRHHGELPAPMKFTLGLGSEYRNARMNWNYYNEERGRIDYYGNVFTNARGSFSVQLTHMSTYLVSRKAIYGAEDRSGAIALGDIGETTVVGDYAITLTGDKENPNTGVGGK